MNGMEKITARLEADLQAEIDALNDETAQQCETIRRDFAKQAEEEYWKRIKEGTKACENRTQRMESAADLEVRKSILGFKQEMVTRAFDAAVEKLVSMPRADYVAFLASQAAKAATYGTEELIFNAADAAEVGREVASAANALLRERGAHGGLTVSAETRDIPGGLILRQGDIEVNCAADTLVAMSRSALASQVAEILFT